MSIVTAVAQADFEREAVQAEGLVVVDFSASWCGPCKRMLPELEAAATELGSRATFLTVDVDESPEVAVRFGVQGVPNLTFLKGGQVVDVVIGAIPRAMIIDRVKKHLKSEANLAGLGSTSG